MRAKALQIQRTRRGTAGLKPFVCEQRPVSQHLTHLGYSAFNIVVQYKKKCNCIIATFKNKFTLFKDTVIMALTIIRTTIIFVTLLVVMRLMGKRQIGEMQPFELVITLLIAELACIPMADTSIPLLYGIVAILAIFLLHQLICLIDLNFKPFKVLFSGKPAIVMNKNGIDVYQLRKNNLDITDLIESLRTVGIFSLEQVDYALYEANGQFSAIPKQENSNNEKPTLPLLIIDNGKFEDKNLQLMKTDKDFILQQLKNQNVKSVKRIFVLTIDGEGNAYLQMRGEKYKTFKIQLPKECVW